MVTIKQIAEMCGVSRGTVDRVLNNRGNVKREKRDLILSTAKKLNYTPNPAGRALAARQNKPVLGILLPAKGLRFFDDVINAMKKSEEKYSMFGLDTVWKMTEGYDVDAQCKAMDELIPKVNALIINPINSEKVSERLDSCAKKGIFVVTLNNDIQNGNRNCYVGSDYYNGGETAAALLKMIRPQGGAVGVVLGSLQMYGHQQRLEGFRSVLEKDGRFPIVAVEEDNDDDFHGYEKVYGMLKAHDDIKALFFAASGGTYGACRAIIALGRERDMTVVSFDTVPEIIEMIKNGVIDATIYQHPRRQGQKAMQLVYDYLINGIGPDRELHIMKNDIRILQNI